MGDGHLRLGRDRDGHLSPRKAVDGNLVMESVVNSLNAERIRKKLFIRSVIPCGFYRIMKGFYMEIFWGNLRIL